MLRLIFVSLALCGGGVSMKVTPPGKPSRVVCTVPAVDCSDADEETQAQCTALALQGNQTVVVKSKQQPRKYLVAIWKDACR